MGKYSSYFYKGKKKKVLKTRAQGLDIGTWKMSRKQQMIKMESLRHSMSSLKIKCFFFNRLKKLTVYHETAISWLYQDFIKASIF